MLLILMSFSNSAFLYAQGVLPGDTGASGQTQQTEEPKTDLPDWEPEKTTPPSMEKFDVSTYLKLQGAQSYLRDESKQEAAVGVFIVNFISLLTKIIGSFALLVIIVGGITIMISTGNQNLQTKGKEMIKFAIIGLIVAFMSLIIVTFVQSLFYTY